jgi:hypothetical protein
MSEPYSNELIELAEEIANENGIKVHKECMLLCGAES